MPEEGASIRFDIPMPKSWAKSQHGIYRNKPHRDRPDLDNLVKAVLDALMGEDCTVWHLGSVEKRWSDVGQFTISLSPLPDSAI
jgi:Holliday junction resolvase RusA-like endonuclease